METSNEANGLPKLPVAKRASSSSEADLFELPEATRSSAPQKVINFKCQKRDVLALVEVAAATGIPLNLTDETKELFPESTYALYDDFRAADPIESILARVMCAISSMTMDALSRARRTANVRFQRDGPQMGYKRRFGVGATH